MRSHCEVYQYRCPLFLPGKEGNTRCNTPFVLLESCTPFQCTSERSQIYARRNEKYGREKVQVQKASKGERESGRERQTDVAANETAV